MRRYEEDAGTTRSRSSRAPMPHHQLHTSSDATLGPRTVRKPSRSPSSAAVDVVSTARLTTTQDPCVRENAEPEPESEPIICRSQKWNIPHRGVGWTSLDAFCDGCLLRYVVCVLLFFWMLDVGCGVRIYQSAILRVRVY